MGKAKNMANQFYDGMATIEAEAKVIFQDQYTIVILEDGRKGIAACHPDDEFDEAEGIRFAFARALMAKPRPEKEIKRKNTYEFLLSFSRRDGYGSGRTLVSSDNQTVDANRIMEWEALLEKNQGFKVYITNVVLLDEKKVQF